MRIFDLALKNIRECEKNVVVKSFKDNILQSLCVFPDLQGKILAGMEKATAVQNFYLNILVVKQMYALEKFRQVKTDSSLGV